MEVGELPSIGLLSDMLIELKHVSSLHVADKLKGEQAATLHSDGTPKFGHKYSSFQIATRDRVSSVGLMEMKCGTADHTLEVLNGGS